MIFTTESQLKENADKIPADKKAPIETALEKLKAAHKSQDLAAIDTAMAEINAAWQTASAEMYSQSGAQAGAAGAEGIAGAAGAGSAGVESGLLGASADHPSSMRTSSSPANRCRPRPVIRADRVEKNGVIGKISRVRVGWIMTRWRHFSEQNAVCATLEDLSAWRVERPCLC